MSDDLVLNGKNYVSSKKAAQLTGYARDYIGQLSRGRQIDAERVGGLWYVSMESLQNYEKNAELAKSLSPIVSSRDTESSLSFEGKEYVSASRASKLSGYNQDYVGQLARGGKIPSRQIGNRWYVDREALLEHKTEKDALLAAVQAQSVGIQPMRAQVEAHMHTENPISSLKYNTEDRDLLPRIPEKEEVVHYPVSNFTEIRHTHTPESDVAVPVRSSAVLHKPHMQPAFAQKKGKKRIVALSAGVFTILLVVSVGISYFKGTATFAGIRQAPAVAGMSASAAEAFGSVGDVIENWVSPMLVYNRQ